MQRMPVSVKLRGWVTATKRLTGILAVCLVLVTLGALVWRSQLQARVAASQAITSPHGIDESRFITIGGINQWVQIRGEDRANPVLLVLHGGPGSSFIPYTPLFRKWERYFTVVLWDQRGTSRTYGHNTLPDGDTMTIDRMTADGLELSAYLRSHLRKDKLMLLGHSWGSVLGVGMAMTKPQWYSVFIGTGFIVSEVPDWVAAFDILVAKVGASQNQTALSELTNIGPPPYTDAYAQKVHDRWIHRYNAKEEKTLRSAAWKMVLTAPRYSFSDIRDFFASAEFSERITYDELYAYDARKRTQQFQMPVVIIEGTEDLITPASFIKLYFDQIRAPAKSFALIEGGGHNVIVTKPQAFLKMLLAEVGELSSTTKAVIH